jgi:hypothetical protein
MVMVSIVHKQYDHFLTIPVKINVQLTHLRNAVLIYDYVFIYLLAITIFIEHIFILTG